MSQRPTSFENPQTDRINQPSGHQTNRGKENNVEICKDSLDI